MSELTGLTDNVPLPGLPVPYAQAVVEESIRRRVEEVGIRITDLAQKGHPGDMLAEVARQDRIIADAQVRWALVAGGQECSTREIQESFWAPAPRIVDRDSPSISR